MEHGGFGAWARGIGVGLGLAFAFACTGPAGDSPHTVYVTLGFHGNFYHSWRGDTPDEAGFGTDIRVVREILRILDGANAEGLDARGYWDTENLFTYERILPEYAPDILEAIRRRVGAGLDEILLMPYDNGLLHAMTREELSANVRWAITNPWGSGARDLFGTFTPLLRPQEMTLTAGSLPILAREGVEGLVLLYAGVPFNALSAFVPVLPPEQRYGVTRVRLRDDGPALLLLPASSIGDVVDHVSFEKWLLDLRALQTSGAVDRDLLLHLNADADGDFWLPQSLPKGLGWLPNAGGLREYIEAVNRYDWAEFTTPGEFLAGREPLGEVLVRQDLADGAYDGQYSWAEKFASHAIWTLLEQSRLATWRAEALSEGAPEALRAEARALLWKDRDSSFADRIEGLSTTHFGMSTPVVNEERQAVAEAIAGRARDRARRAERMLAEAAAGRGELGASAQALYVFEVRDARAAEGPTARTLLRLPVLFDGAPPVTRLEDGRGRSLPHALVDVDDLGDGRVAAELWTLVHLVPGEGRELRLLPSPRAGGAPAEGSGDASPRSLENEHLRIALAPDRGIVELRAGPWRAGGADFLSAFVTYRSGDEPVPWGNDAWDLEAPGDAHPGWLHRARLRTRVPFPTPEDGEVAAEVEVTLSLPARVPWVVADVEVVYPYTTKRDVLHTSAQKLRRFLDLRWIEVAPFQLHPSLESAPDTPLRVWKHNYLDVTSYYDLDYGRINPRNAEVEAFNHQVTAGWVAVSDRSHGLLVAEDADVRASFAFAPMRLREREGRQQLWINPFGSYHGRQLDYGHLDGTGVGAEVTAHFSSSLRPNGPSYNGQRERFSLLLAPYSGDAPPEDLRADARVFFAGPAVVYRRAPAAAGADARLAFQVREAVADARRSRARLREGTLPVPRALLVNPTVGAADVVWDEPRDPRVDGYRVAWRRVGEEEWREESIGVAARHRITALEDGAAYEVRLRAVGAGSESAWTETARVSIGPVEVVEMADALSEMSPGLIWRMFQSALVHIWSTL